ncbi:hypothetical protein [Sphingobacterium hotanense]|uniref:DUF2892 domain-containing protein n=1 Tax=Sphingobacterium hotanense TaxID=649196 RepID=A0ABT7NIE9_9SPHI|nr:hypothetical protein [Sphingobacterium hotanense]MDM1046965.1 hypothetical protein [Sphingobacterium hotanense]
MKEEDGYFVDKRKDENMNYLRSWNVIRLLRLAMGVVITIQGVMASHWLIAGLGALFTLLPILNINTCSSGACEVPRRKTITSKQENGPSSYEKLN